MNQDKPTPDDVVRKTAAMVRLLHKLMDDYGNELSQDVEFGAPAPTVDLVGFVAWLRNRLPMTSIDEIENYLTATNTTMPVWDMMVEIIEHEAGINRLVPLWPEIMLANRPNPTYPLSSICTLVVLRWKDGKAIPLSSFIPWEFAGLDHTFTDGMCCSMVQTSAHNLSHILGDTGLDKLHAQSFRAEPRHFEVMINLMKAIASGEVSVINKDREIRAIPDIDREGCLSAVSLLSDMFVPPVPEGVAPQLAKVRAQIAAKAQDAAAPATKPPQPTSGWA